MEQADPYATRRARLAAGLAPDLRPDQLVTICFAMVPWLDETPATFAFFEEMRTVHEAAGLEPTGDPIELWDAAYELVGTYKEVARRHDAPGYVSAAEAALAGADPASLEMSTDSISLDGKIPARVALRVGEARIELEALESKKGNLWYSVVDDTCQPARGGVAIEPTGLLPTVVELAGAKITLGPAPVYDRETRRYRDDEFEPFDPKRVVERPITMGGHHFEARVVVSVRRDGRWNVTARLIPQESIPASSVGRSGASGRRTAQGQESGGGAHELSERELIEALRDR